MAQRVPTEVWSVLPQRPSAACATQLSARSVGRRTEKQASRSSLLGLSWRAAGCSAARPSARLSGTRVERSRASRSGAGEAGEVELVPVGVAVRAVYRSCSAS